MIQTLPFVEHPHIARLVLEEHSKFAKRTYRKHAALQYSGSLSDLMGYVGGSVLEEGEMPYETFKKRAMTFLAKVTDVRGAAGFNFGFGQRGRLIYFSPSSTMERRLADLALNIKYGARWGGMATGKVQIAETHNLTLPSGTSCKVYIREWNQEIHPEAPFYYEIILAMKNRNYADGEKKQRIGGIGWMFQDMGKGKPAVHITNVQGYKIEDLTDYNGKEYHEVYPTLNKALGMKWQVYLIQKLRDYALERGYGFRASLPKFWGREKSDKIKAFYEAAGLRQTAEGHFE